MTCRLHAPGGAAKRLRRPSLRIRRILTMENLGVTCDVSACCHNMSGCKCNLSEIKVTGNCGCGQAEMPNPHFCCSYEAR